MIHPEGRVLFGVDEFMLRTGYLKLVALIANKAGGDPLRVERQLAEFLGRPYPLRLEEIPFMAKYLYEKSLCDVRLPDGTVRETKQKGRYKGLEVVFDSAGDPTIIRDRRGSDSVSVWWQDSALASPQLPSAVGAVTFSSRTHGAKTGLSHIIDWASQLEIINRRGTLTVYGQTLHSVSEALRGGRRFEDLSYNPFVLEEERVIIAHLLFRRDADIIVRLLPKLVNRCAIRKSEARAIFIDVAKELHADLQTVGTIGRALEWRRCAARLVKELQRAPRRGADPVDSSTAWHRAASRFESLVDLGLLTKLDAQGRSHSFEYYYEPSPRLQNFAQSLKGAESASDWLAKQLIPLITDSTKKSKSGRITWADVLPNLVHAYELIKRPIGPMHIESLALSACCLALRNGGAIDLAEMRLAIENLAREKPDVARLSRGYAGSRPEWVSIDAGALRRLS